ncbi:MAG TPA: RagB/SusD family nutrient uptake outer membrane protein, partial [Bacteroidales bacterium]|nr:RagB/SusD family nutrient uptake outer membrane protein [Bacteroidales bacterium]
YGRFTDTYEDLRSDGTHAESPWTEFTHAGDFQTLPVSFQDNRVWRAYYIGVFRANQVLEHVPGIKMDSNLKKRLLAETHFLRGIFYFNLLKMYHNIPLVLHTSSDPSKFDVPQTSPDSVWMQIDKDFQAAIPDLPLKYSGDNVGRATKGAAEAYLGKSYLFQKKYQAAATEFKKVIDSGVYGLVANDRDNFDKKGENNKESIFEVQFSSTLGGSGTANGNGIWGTPQPNWGENNLRGNTYAPSGFGWADIEPTHTLENEFLQDSTINGNVDPRLPASLFYYYPGETVYGVPYKQAYPNSYKTAIFWRKYERDTPGGNESDVKNGIDNRLMRYADVLLMYAECLNDMGQTNSAYKYIDMVRSRANLPKLANTKPNMTQSQMMTQIAHTRFLEFCGEEHRYDDILRWGWLKDPQKLKWLQQRDPEFNGYKPGHEYLPIPQSALDANPKLHQNPGY